MGGKSWRKQRALYGQPLNTRKVVQARLLYQCMVCGMFFPPDMPPVVNMKILAYVFKKGELLMKKYTHKHKKNHSIKIVTNLPLNIRRFCFGQQSRHLGMFGCVSALAQRFSAVTSRNHYDFLDCVPVSRFSS